MPILGIGLPVYNDEKTIGDAIENVLNQTLQDFELHVYDNCSTDNTLNIIKKYAKQDKRIFVHQNSTNVGMANNFNKCLWIKNFKDYKYVSIKSANDKIDPTYYEKCIKFLENNSDFVACYSEGTNTVNNSVPMCSYEQDDVWERIESMIETQGYGNTNYGVFRSDIIDKVLPIQHIQGFDHIFFLNLVMLGKMKKLEEVLYDREPPIHRTEETYRKSCCSSISGRIMAMPHFMELLSGFIDFCNNCYLNGLDRQRLINTVINVSLKYRYDIICKQYNMFAKMIKRRNNLDENDYVILKHIFQKVRMYLLQNKKFRKEHKKDSFYNYVSSLIK